MNIVRLTDIPWEERVNVDNWPCRAGTYYDNRDNELCIRLIDYPLGSTEPRHVHAGMHATTVLKGRAIIDELTLELLDVIIGPSDEPHGPLHYPEGCHLLSAFQGSLFHREVEELPGEKQYRLIQEKDLAWTPVDDDTEVKTLVDHGVGQLWVEAMRFAPGSRHEPKFLAALVVDGGVEADGQTLGKWDFMYADEGDARSSLAFTQDATLLAFTMHE